MFPRAPVKHQRFQHLSLQEEAVQVLRVWYDDSSGVEDHSPGSLLAPVLVSLLQGNMPPCTPDTVLPTSALCKEARQGCTGLCCLHTGTGFLSSFRCTERLQTPKHLLHSHRPRHHEGLSSSRTSTEHVLYKPACPQATAGPFCPPPSCISLINKQETRLVVDRERKTYAPTFSLFKTFPISWAGKFKMEEEGITPILTLECEAISAFTGRKMAEPFRKAACDVRSQPWNAHVLHLTR